MCLNVFPWRGFTQCCWYTLFPWRGSQLWLTLLFFLVHVVVCVVDLSDCGHISGVGCSLSISSFDWPLTCSSVAPGKVGWVRKDCVCCFDLCLGYCLWSGRDRVQGPSVQLPWCSSTFQFCLATLPFSRGDHPPACSAHWSCHNWHLVTVKVSNTPCSLLPQQLHVSMGSLSGFPCPP